MKFKVNEGQKRRIKFLAFNELLSEFEDENISNLQMTIILNKVIYNYLHYEIKDEDFEEIMQELRTEIECFYREGD